MDYPDFIPSTQMLDSTQSLQAEEETETFKNVTLGTLIVDEKRYCVQTSLSTRTFPNLLDALYHGEQWREY